MMHLKSSLSLVEHPFGFEGGRVEKRVHRTGKASELGGIVSWSQTPSFLDNNNNNSSTLVAHFQALPDVDSKCSYSSLLCMAI